MKRVDAIIIGFGKGGKILAADLAKRNWEVAMEKPREFDPFGQTGLPPLATI